MGRIVVFTKVHAPIDRVFDLVRSIKLHNYAEREHGECVVGETSSGLIELGQEVTWKARHLGFWRKLTAQVTEYDRPHHFRDSQIKGAFKLYNHDHFLQKELDGTVVKDVIEYTVPYGLLGRIANRLFLESYLEFMFTRRQETLKQVAESNDWEEFLNE